MLVCVSAGEAQASAEARQHSRDERDRQLDEVNKHDEQALLVFFEHFQPIFAQQRKVCICLSSDSRAT